MITTDTHQLFVLLDYISVFVMLFCCVVISSHSAGRMQKLALLVCISLTMCCIGFLFRAEATCADDYILGQKLIYMFVTHGMFLMLLFILEYCRMSIPKHLEYAFHLVNFAITIIVLTMNHHQLFYKKYWAVPMDGYIDLEKEYGFMHTVTVGLFALYMVAAIAIALYFSGKNMRTRTKYVWRMLVAVMLPCLSYAIPKITGINNDFQPIAFAAFAVMVLVMIYKSKLYDIENIVANYAMGAMDDALIAFDSKYRFKGCNDAALQFFPELRKTYLDIDISEDYPVLRKMIDSKIVEYTANGRFYKVSSRPIDGKNASLGKIIKLSDMTLQHDYTELLQASRDRLKSEVKTLTSYSYTDELTGLFNRRRFEDDIEEIKAAPPKSVSVCAVDLNGLKQVNDTVGHIAGDEIIAAAAGILLEVYGKHGKLYRTGGDEFYIILQPTPADVEGLVAEMDTKIAAWSGERVKSLSLSYGFAFSDNDVAANIDQLLLEADKAMYTFKRNYYMSHGQDRRQR